MIGGLVSALYTLLRVSEVVTLIPIVGMLAYFVNIYVGDNAVTPTSILVLFIVSVIALAWALFTFFLWHRSEFASTIITLIDLAVLGGLIAGVYELRGIRNADCTTATWSTWDVSAGSFSASGPGLNMSTDKACAMLKASWVLAIINIVFFFLTAILALAYSRHAAREYETRRYKHSRRW